MRTFPWLACPSGEREPDGELQHIQRREKRHQLVVQTHAPQSALSEQTDAHHPSQRPHRVRPPYPFHDETRRLELASQPALRVPAVMTDISIEPPQQRRVRGHQQRKDPTRRQQIVDGLDGGCVVGDMLQDVDADGGVETIAS